MAQLSRSHELGQTRTAAHTHTHIHAVIRQEAVLRDLFQCCTWLTRWPDPSEIEREQQQQQLPINSKKPLRRLRLARGIRLDQDPELDCGSEPPNANG